MDYVDKILQGDSREVLKTLSAGIADCCITSPPYYALRDYGNDAQIGLEKTPEEYVAELVKVFHEIKRILKDDGTLWLNIGDSYWGSGSRGYDFTGKFTDASKVQMNSKGTVDLSSVPKLVGNNGQYKNKDLIGIPWMLAFALRADGWYLRQDIIWAKPNPMPESVTDRCTKSHEYIFLLSKSPQYFFDFEAIQENATSKDDPRSVKGRIACGDKRNKRDVWRISVKPIRDAHFATYPEELVETCLLAGCPVGGLVIDPFFGSGTTGRVAQKMNRHFVGVELNKEYIEIGQKRNSNIQLSLFGLI